MLNLIVKEKLSKEELQQLDNYFFADHLDELLSLDYQIIIRFIKLTEEVLGFSLTKKDLQFSLNLKTFDCKVFFDENDLDLYNKILALIEYFEFEDSGLAYVIGDYYYYENDNNTAILYYSKIFKKGFDLSSDGYSDSLIRYLELLDDSSIDLLEELILYSNKDQYTIEFINTYLLLINRLDINSPSYLKYLDTVIEIIIPLVRTYQKSLSNDVVISDSDIERNLCELLALKMQYYVVLKDYIKAFELYKELTYEIEQSDCMRYYHVRDEFYYHMLKDMSEEYLELKFFDDIENTIFRIVDNVKLIKDLEIVLENKNGLRLMFIVINIYNNNDIVIAPILPLLGVGGYMFVKLIMIDDKLYLQNKF